MNFLCCVVGTAKNDLAVPHCEIIFHHCCHLRSTILLISLLISLLDRARAGDEGWTATALSFAIPSTTSLPVIPECPRTTRTHANSIWQLSFADTNSSIVSSTILLVGFRKKMDCKADFESVHSLTFVPLGLWGFEISHNSAACMATRRCLKKTETSPRAPPPSPITTSPRLAKKVSLPFFEASNSVMSPKATTAILLATFQDGRNFLDQPANCAGSPRRRQSIISGESAKHSNWRKHSPPPPNCQPFWTW